MAEETYYTVKQSSLTAVADAIREKGGTSESLSFPNGFVNAVEALSTGSGSGGGGFLITITEQYPHYVMDKTLREIKEAVSNGICPTVYFTPENSYGTFAYMTPLGSSTNISVFETYYVPQIYTAASDDAYPHRMGGSNN